MYNDDEGIELITFSNNNYLNEGLFYIKMNIKSLFSVLEKHFIWCQTVFYSTVSVHWSGKISPHQLFDINLFLPRFCPETWRRADCWSLLPWCLSETLQCCCGERWAWNLSRQASGSAALWESHFKPKPRGRVVQCISMSTDGPKSNQRLLCAGMFRGSAPKQSWLPSEF